VRRELRLENKVCVVTGGAMGIGRACAAAYAREGAAVLVVDLADDEGQATVRELVALGGRAEFVRADVASPQECRSTVDRALEVFGRLDVMHANAGIELCKSVLDTSDAEWERVISVNLSGVFYCCREALRTMRTQKTPGSILVTASPLALATGRDIAAYTASKGGVVAFVRALALEAAEFGVRANALLPGTTETPMIRREVAAATDPELMLKRWADSVPLGRLAQPEDIAEGAVFLVSDAARFVTGTCLAVDGGQLAAVNTGPVHGYTD
jgi:NAD(P)-dependent dehydrogenase (short-subunit alcohol dehydrogenase family)